MTFSAEQSELLIRLLALQDSVYVPFRDPVSLWWASAWSLRLKYHEEGMPWRSRDESNSERVEMVQ